MADTPAKNAKLVQYLNEANAKEKELEAALDRSHRMSEMADRKPYKKKLQEHLRETKNHSKALERRIKKLGGAGQRDRKRRRNGRQDGRQSARPGSLGREGPAPHGARHLA